MAENEFSLKPTLEIDNSKDIKSLNSIITSVKRGGRNNTFNIINNHGASDKEKYLSLWEENNRLIGIINEIQSKLTELENEFNYNEYLFYAYNSENRLAFEMLLNYFIIDITRKSNKDEKYITYIVNKKDWEIFLGCLAVYNEKMTEEELLKELSTQYKDKIKKEITY